MWTESNSTLLATLAEMSVKESQCNLKAAVDLCRTRLDKATALVEQHKDAYRDENDCIDAVTIAISLCTFADEDVQAASAIKLKDEKKCHGIVDLARRGCAWEGRALPAVRKGPSWAGVITADRDLKRRTTKLDLVTEALSLLETITNSMKVGR